MRRGTVSICRPSLSKFPETSSPALTCVRPRRGRHLQRFIGTTFAVSSLWRKRRPSTSRALLSVCPDFRWVVTSKSAKLIRFPDTFKTCPLLAGLVLKAIGLWENVYSLCILNLNMHMNDMDLVHLRRCVHWFRGQIMHWLSLLSRSMLRLNTSKLLNIQTSEHFILLFVGRMSLSSFLTVLWCSGIKILCDLLSKSDLVLLLD